jgi:serine/threonine protein kinase
VERPSLTLDRVVAGMLKNEDCKVNSDLRRRYVAKIFSVLRIVAKTLQRLHSFGVVHGNICPENCGKFDDNWKLLGTLKLQKIGEKFDVARFGVSVPPEAVEPKSSTIALQRQATFCTNVDVDPSLDIWGFGILAYDVLVGEPLFKFDPRKELCQNHEALLKILHWSTLDLVEVRRCLRQASVPDLGVDLIAKCLSQEAGSRPSNMNEILRSGLWDGLRRPALTQESSNLHEC